MRQHIPNALTVSRLIGAGLFIAALAVWEARGPDGDAWLVLLAALIFVIAVITDALDGYLARRWNVISVFGRVMDPLADKIIVLGGFVMLASPAFVVIREGTAVDLSGVDAWMVVVILSRELLVTSIRSVMEARGVDFSASFTGKAKMFLQSVAVPLILVLVWLAETSEANWLGGVPTWNAVIAWAVVLVTVLSGVPYVTRAAKAGKQLSS
jgi:CDP-diacylglycerol--glycerol-3-phosphate 3-phosphatidyltransferase